MTSITSEEELDKFLKDYPNNIILKHSTTCSISARALSEFNNFAPNCPCPMGIILVRENRPASNRLAQISKVTHQSPQILIFKEGKFYKDLSHFNITQDNLKEIIKKPSR